MEHSAEIPLHNTVPVPVRSSSVAFRPPIPPEVYDGHEYVDFLGEIRDDNAWYSISAVRVQYVYQGIDDCGFPYLQLFLIDRRGDTLAAYVPRRLVEKYHRRDLLGRVFKIHHFQRTRAEPDWPRHGGYTLHRNAIDIYVSEGTHITLTHLEIPSHPLTPALNMLAADTTIRKMIIDVRGRITYACKISNRPLYDPTRPVCWELHISDTINTVMKVVLLHYRNVHMGMITTAVNRNALIYISRVKLMHDRSANFLLSTDLTAIHIFPANATRLYEPYEDIS